MLLGHLTRVSPATALDELWILAVTMRQPGELSPLPNARSSLGRRRRWTEKALAQFHLQILELALATLALAERNNR